MSIFSEWEKDPEFKALPVEKKQGILSNYFDSNMVDAEYNSLPEPRKAAIKQNYVNSHFQGQYEGPRSPVPAAPKQMKALDVASLPSRPGVMGTLQDIPLAVGRGAIDLAGMINKGAQTLTETLPAFVTGKDMEKGYNESFFTPGIQKLAELRQIPALAPSKESQEGFARGAISGGFEALLPSMGPMVATAVNPMAGLAATAALFGGGEVGSFLEEARAQGKGIRESVPAALGSGAIEAGGEFLADLLGAKILGLNKATLLPFKTTIKEMLKGNIKKSLLNVLKDMPVEIGTEMAQEAGETAIRKAKGMEAPEPWEAAKDVIGPTMVLTMLFGAGAHGYDAAHRYNLSKNLTILKADPAARMQAAQEIAQGIMGEPTGTDAQGQPVYDPQKQALASQWQDYVFNRITNKRAVPIEQETEKLLSVFSATQKGELDEKSNIAAREFLNKIMKKNLKEIPESTGQAGALAIPGEAGLVGPGIPEAVPVPGTGYPVLSQTTLPAGSEGRKMLETGMEGGIPMPGAPEQALAKSESGPPATFAELWGPDLPGPGMPMPAHAGGGYQEALPQGRGFEQPPISGQGPIPGQRAIGTGMEGGIPQGPGPAPQFPALPPGQFAMPAAPEEDIFKPDIEPISATIEKQTGGLQNVQQNSQTTVPQQAITAIPVEAGKAGQSVAGQTLPGKESQVGQVPEVQGLGQGKIKVSTQAAPEIQALLDKHSQVPSAPIEIIDREMNLRQRLEGAKEPDSVIKALKDNVLGDYGVTGEADFQTAVEQLEKAKIPYVLEVADGWNLGGLNEHYKDQGKNSRANDDLKKVWGEIYGNEVRRFGGIIARSKGDEFAVAWPNYTEDQVVEIRQAIEVKMRQKAQEIGIPVDLAHPKLGGIPTGALGTAYGLSQAQPGKHGEANRIAIDRMGMMKLAEKLAIEEKIAYTKSHELRKNDEEDRNRPEPANAGSIEDIGNKGRPGNERGGPGSPSQVPGTPAAAAEQPTAAVAPAPEAVETPAPTEQPPGRFAQELTAAGVPAEAAAKTSAALEQALVDPKAAKELLYPDNRISRKIWQRETGTKLPRMLSGTHKAIDNYFAEQVAAQPQEQAAAAPQSEAAPAATQENASTLTGKPQETAPQEKIAYSAEEPTGKVVGPLYHGTKKVFVGFDNRAIESEDGFFFTTKAGNAREYAGKTGRVIPAFIEAKKTYTTTYKQWQNAEGLSPKEAWAKGYDSYLIKGMDGGDTWIVPSDKQISQKNKEFSTEPGPGNIDQTIKTRVVKNDKLYEIFNDAIQSGPLDGGCYAMAKALQNVFGGELYTLAGTRNGKRQGEHIILKLDNSYYDADGQSTGAQLIKRWSDEEGVKGGTLRPFQETDVPESPRDEALIQKVVDHLKRGEAYSTKPGPGKITPEMIKSLFNGQEITDLGNDEYNIALKNGRDIRISMVPEISGDKTTFKVKYGRAQKRGEKIVGKASMYEGNETGFISLVKGAAGELTLAHESFHILEFMGIVSPHEINIIKNRIRQLVKEGKFEPVGGDIGGVEDRARFMAKLLTDKNPTGIMATIARKIREFIDRIKNFMGTRTPEGVARDITSGKIYKKEAEGTETATAFSSKEISSEQEDFGKQVDAFLAGNLGDKPIVIGKTPEVLKRLGAKDLEVVIDKKTIKKVLLEKHGISAEILKQLPEQLHDPIMVFDSATEKNSMVVMTELQHEGKTIIAAVHLGKRLGRHIVNDIASVHPRESDSHFTNWINAGLLRYVNKEKSRRWFMTRGLQLPKVRGTNRDSIKSIVYNTDIVKPVGENDKEAYSTDTLSDYQKENISWKPGGFDWSGEGLKDLAAKAYTNFLMREYPIVRFAGKAGRAAQAAIENQIRRIRGKGGIVEDILSGAGPSKLNDDGTVERRGSPSLKDILQPISSRQEYVDYETMRVALRDIALAVYRPDVAGTNPAESLKELNRISGRYAGATQKVTIGGNDIDVPDKLMEISRKHRQFEIQAVLDPLHDAGWLSDANYQSIIEAPEGEFYASFMREMEEAESYVVGSGGSPVKKIKGTERDLKKIPSVEATIANVQRTIKMVEQSRLNKEVVKLKDAGPDYAEQVQEVKPNYIPVKQVLKQEIDPEMYRQLRRICDIIGTSFEKLKNIGGKLGVWHSGNPDDIDVMFATTERTIAHELGHALDDRFGLVEQMISKGNEPIKKQLRLIADTRASAGSTAGYKKYCRKRTEQVAEFVARYLSRREWTSRVAPDAVMQFEQILRENGLEELTKIGPSGQQSTDTLSDTVFAESPIAPKGTIVVPKNGKKTYWKVPPEVKEALDQPFTANEMSTVVKLLNLPAKTLRAGATLSAEFILRNPFRDQLSAMIYSRYGYNPFTDFAKGVFHLLKKDDLYREYQASGAEQSYFISVDRDSTEVKARNLTGYAGKGFQWGYLNPLKPFQIVSEWMEKGTRLGAYGKARAKGASSLEAMAEAREITLDFARMGAQGRALNQIIAFWNANVQGTDKMVRAFKQKPGQTLFKVVSGITLPSMLLWFLNKDDDRYKELPDWQKNFFWILPIGKDGPILRFPKPFELGVIFGSGPERLLDWIYNKDPESLKSIGASIAGGAFPGLIPTAALPILEHITNYSFFMGRKLENMGVSRLSPGMRTTPFTSQIAADAGKLTDVSPIMMENWVRGWTGTLGAAALRGADKAYQKAKGSEIPEVGRKWYEEAPGIKGFISKEGIGGGSKTVERFYNVLEKTSQAKADYDTLKRSNPEEARAYRQKHFTDIRFAHSASLQSRRLNNLRKRRARIMSDSTMDSETKREQIDKIERLASEIAARFMRRYDSIE